MYLGNDFRARATKRKRFSGPVDRVPSIDPPHNKTPPKRATRPATKRAQKSRKLIRLTKTRRPNKAAQKETHPASHHKNIACTHTPQPHLQQDRAEARKAEIERIAEEKAAAEQARLCAADPVVAAATAVAAAEQAQKEADEATTAAEAAAAAAAAPLTAQKIREAAQRRAHQRRTPNPNNEEQLEELRKLAKEAEEAVGAHKQHPFACWKVCVGRGGGVGIVLSRLLCFSVLLGFGHVGS